jgi:hypothetical protein
MDMAACVRVLTVGTTLALVYSRKVRLLWQAATFNLCKHLPGFFVNSLGFHQAESMDDPVLDWFAVVPSSSVFKV